MRRVAVAIVALIGLAVPMALAGPRGPDQPRRPTAPAPPAPPPTWTERAERAQAVLLREYHNHCPGQGRPGVFRLRAPARLVDRIRLVYWWQAQALDVLVDAQERAPSAAGLRRIRCFVRGLRVSNGGRIGNDYYDDMEWMALALLRADAVGAQTIALVRRLWRDIHRGWNEVHGGGIPWRLQQPAYKNVPANGPAAILAARLYRRDGRPADLAWAQRIVTWIHATLVDPETGVVWDGVNRLGDGRIDRHWVFTYTHGVVLGADLELAALTGERKFRDRAERTARVVLERLAPGGVLRDEGGGDRALFKGILVRYLAALDAPAVDAMLHRSAEAAWAARDAAGRFGQSWTRAPAGGAELSAHLSGTMLLERLAAREAGHDSASAPRKKAP